MKFKLDTFKMGYIILYKNEGNNLFGKGIIAKQLAAGFSAEAAQYTHAEVSGGSEFSVNISPPVSKLINITKTHKGRYVCLMRYKNDVYEAKGRYKVAYFSATLANKMYDVKGILSFIFKWITHDNRLYFCSEGAAWALQKEFPEAFNGRTPNKIMPADFLNLFIFEKVWEGRIGG